MFDSIAQRLKDRRAERAKLREMRREFAKAATAALIDGDAVTVEAAVEAGKEALQAKYGTDPNFADLVAKLLELFGPLLVDLLERLLDSLLGD